MKPQITYFHALEAFQRCQVGVEKESYLSWYFDGVFHGVLVVDRHTPWFPLESLRIELDFRILEILLKIHLNSWIATINILNINLLPRVYNIFIIY